MVLKILVVCFIFAILQDEVYAQFQKCDFVRNLLNTKQSVTVNHLSRLGSCRYLVTSPVDTFIKASCTVSTTCNNQVFTISKAGEYDLSDGQTFCGGGTTPVIKSIGNEILVALNNGNFTPGSFNCKFTAVAQTNTNCDCGWSVNKKIVGGGPTGVNEIVSHAGLVNTNTTAIYCGAIIISQLWSVTAARCIDNNPNPSTTGLLVGDWDTTRGDDTKWTKLYSVASFIKHPGYQVDGNINDVALVKTNNYVKFNYAVGPACLPYIFDGSSFVGYSLTAVGWGTTSFGGPTSAVLKKADLSVISNDECSKSYPGLIDETKICTYGGRVRDTCGMDNGGGKGRFLNDVIEKHYDLNGGCMNGERIFCMTSFMNSPSLKGSDVISPLGLYRQAGRRYAIAIVSSSSCASSSPSVNSRVDSYIGWIESTLGIFFCRKA